MLRALVTSTATLLLISSAASALPQAVTDYTQVSAGPAHTLALRSNGTIDAWGGNGSGECDVPALPLGISYVQVSAGGYLISGDSYGFSLARRSDGSVVAWGDDYFGIAAVPVLPPGLTYVDISAGTFNALALRSDGSVVAWGDNSRHECDVPALPAGLSCVEISAGGYLRTDILTGPGTWDLTFTPKAFGLARLSDGSVVAWGDDVPGTVPALPPGVSCVGIAAGARDGWLLRSDGLIARLGGWLWSPAQPGLSFVDVEVGGETTVARVSDGSIEQLGASSVLVPGLPSGLTYDGLAAGGGYNVRYLHDTWTGGVNIYEDDTEHVVAHRSDGSVVAWGDNALGQCAAPGNAYAVTCSEPAPLNSTGGSARIRAFGSNSLLANDLQLEALPVPSSVFLFVRGTALTNLPFGDGRIYVGGSLVAINPAGLGSNTLARTTVDLPAVGITSPGTQYFQCWFRDPNSVAAGFNASDAIEITFVP